MQKIHACCTLAVLVYSDTTCTFRIAQLLETAMWLCWKFQSRNLFSREKLSSVYATSIDYARMHKEHTMKFVRQIFSIVHTEFLLDDRGDPGLWSERGQSRAKTSAILRLEFLARATQMYRVYQSTLGCATWQHNVSPIITKILLFREWKNIWFRK